MVIKSKKVTREERLLKDLNERLRNVREAPDGEIYFSNLYWPDFDKEEMEKALYFFSKCERVSVAANFIIV